MHLKPRQFALSLLLSFFISFVAASLHAATHHVSGEVFDCELCSSYSDLPVGVVAGSNEIELAPAQSFACERPPESTAKDTFQDSFARGPPSFSQMTS